MRVLHLVRSTLAACLLCSASAASSPALAQQSAAPPRTAEEIHAARRLWLEQQRLGDSATIWSPVRGARGPVVPGSRAAGAGPVAAPLGVPLGDAYPFPYPGYGAADRGRDRRDERSAFTAPWSFPDPAYPRVNRFHDRFFGQEYLVPPDYGSGMYMLPPDPWRMPPWYWGLMPLGCARVDVIGLAGAVVLEVPLPLLGARTADELELVIDARLTQGLPVQLQALDGRVLRLGAGAELQRLRVQSCPTR